MADIQSNLANFLNDAGVKNAAAFQKLGDALGAIADVAGAISGVGGFISFVISLFNNGPDELQQVLSAIQQIPQNQHAEDLINKLTNLQNDYSKAMTASESIQSLYNQLPLPPSEVLTQLQNILNSVNPLAPPDVSNLGCANAGSGGPWMVPYNLQVFWSDSDSPEVTWPPWTLPINVPQAFGYGEQAPAESADATAFNYIYTLPQWLQAINVFLSIGVVIDPQFVKNWINTIRSMACLMQSVHDYIVTNGIVQLSPGFWTGEILNSWVHWPPYPIYFPPYDLVPSTQKGVFPIMSTPTTIVSNPVGAEIEYGAVEKFSGYSSVGMYQLPFPQLNLQSNDSNPYQKFLIRLLRRWKEVYIGVGLPTIWNMINSITRLVGDPPLSRPNFSDWSMRQVAAIAAGQAPLPVNPTPVSLVAVARFLQNTLPSDTPPPPSGPSFANYTSLRSLLEPPGM
jgi:hypothetical protein